MYRLSSPSKARPDGPFSSPGSEPWLPHLDRNSLDESKMLIRWVKSSLMKKRPRLSIAMPAGQTSPPSSSPDLTKQPRYSLSGSLTVTRMDRGSASSPRLSTQRLPFGSITESTG